jgi:hypothetical protein
MWDQALGEHKVRVPDLYGTFGGLRVLFTELDSDVPPPSYPQMCVIQWVKAIHLRAIPREGGRLRWRVDIVRVCDHFPGQPG